jgi:hypothetical protein
MNPFTPYKTSTNSDLHCSDFMTMAERELSAFFHAVSQLFGAEQAERSAEDWLHELSEIEGLPSSTREWRSITAKVLGRLANRVTTPALSTQSQTV